MDMQHSSLPTNNRKPSNEREIAGSAAGYRQRLVVDRNALVRVNPFEDVSLRWLVAVVVVGASRVQLRYC